MIMVFIFAFSAGIYLRQDPLSALLHPLVVHNLHEKLEICLGHCSHQASEDLRCPQAMAGGKVDLVAHDRARHGEGALFLD